MHVKAVGAGVLVELFAVAVGATLPLPPDVRITAALALLTVEFTDWGGSRFGVCLGGRIAGYDADREEDTCAGENLTSGTEWHEENATVNLF